MLGNNNRIEKMRAKKGDQLYKGQKVRAAFTETGEVLGMYVCSRFCYVNVGGPMVQLWHVGLEISIRHPSGDAELALALINVEFREVI